jgi:hypothetical protein
MIEDEFGNQYYGCIYGVLISPEITKNRSDFYVGQTVNFSKRKAADKSINGYTFKYARKEQL